MIKLHLIGEHHSRDEKKRNELLELARASNNFVVATEHQREADIYLTRKYLTEEIGDMVCDLYTCVGSMYCMYLRTQIVDTHDIQSLQLIYEGILSGGYDLTEDVYKTRYKAEFNFAELIMLIEAAIAGPNGLSGLLNHLYSLIINAEFIRDQDVDSLQPNNFKAFPDKESEFKFRNKLELELRDQAFAENIFELMMAVNASDLHINLVYVIVGEKHLPGLVKYLAEQASQLNFEIITHHGYSDVFSEEKKLNTIADSDDLDTNDNNATSATLRTQQPSLGTSPNAFMARRSQSPTRQERTIESEVPALENLTHTQASRN